MDYQACRQCGHANPTSFSYCERCGTAIGTSHSAQSPNGHKPAPSAASPAGHGAEQTVVADSPWKKQQPSNDSDDVADEAEYTTMLDPDFLPGGARFTSPSAAKTPNPEQRPVSSSPVSASPISASPVSPSPDITTALSPRPSSPPPPAPTQHRPVPPEPPEATVRISVPPHRPHPHPAPSQGPAFPRPPAGPPTVLPGLRPEDIPPEELTSSLTGALLGANAAPARPAQKTSYKLVVPVLIIAILIVVGAAAGVTFLARDGIGDFINQIIRGG